MLAKFSAAWVGSLSKAQRRSVAYTTDESIVVEVILLKMIKRNQSFGRIVSLWYVTQKIRAFINFVHIVYNKTWNNTAQYPRDIFIKVVCSVKFGVIQRCSFQFPVHLEMQ